MGPKQGWMANVCPVRNGSMFCYSNFQDTTSYHILTFQNQWSYATEKYILLNLVVYYSALKPVFILEKVRKLFAGTLPAKSLPSALVWVKRWTRVGASVNWWKARRSHQLGYWCLLVLPPAHLLVCAGTGEVRGGDMGRRQQGPTWCVMAAEARGHSGKCRSAEGAGPGSPTGERRKSLTFREADSTLPLLLLGWPRREGGCPEGHQPPAPSQAWCAKPCLPVTGGSDGSPKLTFLNPWINMFF